jgi:hypothetical protein
MEQSPTSEANSNPASQEIPHFYGTWRFISAHKKISKLIKMTITLQSFVPV